MQGTGGIDQTQKFMVDKFFVLEIGEKCQYRKKNFFWGVFLFWKIFLFVYEIKRRLEEISVKTFVMSRDPLKTLGSIKYNTDAKRLWVLLNSDV